MKRSVVMHFVYDDSEFPAGIEHYPEYPLIRLSCKRSGTCSHCGGKILVFYENAPLTTEVYEGDDGEVRCPMCKEITEVEVRDVEKSAYDPKGEQSDTAVFGPNNGPHNLHALRVGA